MKFQEKPIILCIFLLFVSSLIILLEYSNSISLNKFYKLDTTALFDIVETTRTASSSVSNTDDQNKLPIHMIITSASHIDNEQDAIELCSIYSVAYHNSHRIVNVYHRSPLPDADIWSKLGNVRLHQIDNNMCDTTPARNFSIWWFKNNYINRIWGTSHLSDILRLCVVYNYGGIYLDTDYIAVRPFPTNFTYGILEGTGSFINFEKRSTFITELLKYLNDKANYMPQIWGTVGPYLIMAFVRDRKDINISYIHPRHLGMYGGTSVALVVDPNATESGIALLAKMHQLYAIHLSRGMIAMFDKKNRTKYSSDTLLAHLIKNNCAPVYARKLICPEKPNEKSCYFRLKPNYYPQSKSGNKTL